MKVRITFVSGVSQVVDAETGKNMEPENDSFWFGKNAVEWAEEQGYEVINRVEGIRDDGDRAKKHDSITVDGYEYKVSSIETIRTAKVIMRNSALEPIVIRVAVQCHKQSFDGASDSSGCWKWEDETNAKKTTS